MTSWGWAAASVAVGAAAAVMVGDALLNAVLGAARYIPAAEFLYPMYRVEFPVAVRAAGDVPWAARVAHAWMQRARLVSAAVPVEHTASLFPIDEMAAFLVRYGATYRVHVLFGAAALASGAANVLTPAAVRRRWPRAHRASGYVYLAATAIGIPAGVALGHGDAAAGLVGQWAFYGMGTFAALPALVALLAARRRDWAAHRRWMLRSFFAMLSSTVVFRAGIQIVLPLYSAKLAARRHPDWLAEGRIDELRAESRALYPDMYNVLNVFSWSFALLAADLYIQLGEWGFFSTE